MATCQSYNNILHGLWKVTTIKLDKSYYSESNSCNIIDKDFCSSIDFTVQFFPDGKVCWSLPRDHFDSELFDLFQDLLCYELDDQFEENLLDSTKRFELLFRSQSFGQRVPSVLVCKGRKGDLMPAKIKFQFGDLKIARLHAFVGCSFDQSFTLYSVLHESFDCDMMIRGNDGIEHRCHSKLLNMLSDSKTVTWLQGKPSKVIQHVLFFLYTGRLSPDLTLDDSQDILKIVKSEKRLDNFKAALNAHIFHIGSFRRLTDTLERIKGSLSECHSLLTNPSLSRTPLSISQVLHCCIQRLFVCASNCALGISLYEELSSKDRKSIFAYIIDQNYPELVLQIIHALYILADGIPSAHQVELCQSCSSRLAEFGKIVLLTLDSIPPIAKSFAPNFMKDATYNGVKKPLSRRGLSLLKDFRILKGLDHEANKLQEKREGLRLIINETELSPDKFRELFQSLLKQLRDMDEKLQSIHARYSRKLKGHEKKAKLNQINKEFKKYVRRIDIPISFLKFVNQERAVVKFWDDFCTLLQNEEVNRIFGEIGFMKGGVHVRPSFEESSVSVLDNHVNKLCIDLWEKIKSQEELSQLPTDLKITVSNEREFRVHSLIVAARCPWIRRALLSGMTEALERHLRLPHESDEAVHHLLEFIYTGSLSVSAMTPEALVELALVSDRYELEALTSLCAEALVRHIDEHSAVSLHELGLQTNQQKLTHTAFTYLKKNYARIHPDELSHLSTQLQNSLKFDNNDSDSNDSNASDCSDDGTDSCQRIIENAQFDVEAKVEEFRNIVGGDPSDEVLLDILLQAQGDLNRAVNFYLA